MYYFDKLKKANGKMKRRYLTTESNCFVRWIFKKMT